MLSTVEKYKHVDNIQFQKYLTSCSISNKTACVYWNLPNCKWHMHTFKYEMITCYLNSHIFWTAFINNIEKKIEEKQYWKQ